MLKTPLSVVASGQLCELRDMSGRTIGSGFVPVEAHEVARRCKADPDDLISALQSARTALLKHGGTRAVPAVMVVESALRLAGVSVPC